MEQGPGPTDPPPSPRWVATLTSPILLTGAYAWGISAAPAVALASRQMLESGPSLRGGLALLGAGASLVTLLVGVLLERRRSPLAPLVGIWGFLASLLLTWLASPLLIDIARIDSLRGALAAGGFLLYSLAWGVPDVLQRLVPEDDPRADTSTPLEARDQLPATARLVAALGVGTASAVSFFAWKLRDTPRALFAHALAALLSVLVISAAAEIAIGRKGIALPSPASRLRRASSSILLLGLVIGLGGAFQWLLR